MSNNWREGSATNQLRPRFALSHAGADADRLRKLEEAVAGITKAIVELARQLEFVTREINELTSQRR